VAGLGHDDALGDACLGGRRGEARAQRVTGVLDGVEPGRLGRVLHDACDGLIREALPAEVPMGIDAPEQRPVRNPGRREPGTDGTDGTGGRLRSIGDTDRAPRALLIGLG